MMCASNQRQIGAGITIWATEHLDRLPPSYYGSVDVANPQEMMAATLGPDVDGVKQWEGLGWLLHWHCIDSPRCLYCPSCRGDHPYERYGDQLHWGASEQIYTNYHYSGDYDAKGDRIRTIANSSEEVLTTDGLRTSRDFNHVVGANVLHGDCSVIWYQDSTQQVTKTLPNGILNKQDQEKVYGEIWNILYSMK